MIDKYAIFYTFESHKTVWAIADPTHPVSTPQALGQYLSSIYIDRLRFEALVFVLIN
jgi:hypothetical protein